MEHSVCLEAVVCEMNCCEAAYRHLELVYLLHLFCSVSVGAGYLASWNCASYGDSNELIQVLFAAIVWCSDAMFAAHRPPFAASARSYAAPPSGDSGEPAVANVGISVSIEYVWQCRVT